MKRFIIAALMVFPAVLLLGCFQTEMVVKVKPDGSGMLVQTVLVRKDVMNQMRAMAQSFAQEGQPQEELKLLDEKELKETAQKLGEGVSYVKAEEILNENFEGYKAVFSFTDINKLHIDQNPSGSLPSDDSEKKAPQEFITFKFKKGKTSKLTITMPEGKTKKQDTGKNEEEPASSSKTDENTTEETPEATSDPQQEQMMMAMMQEMLKGMKVSIAVEVEGKIIKTNASIQDGNKLILMDIDFDKLLAAQDEFKEFVKTNPETMSEAKEIMKKIPGMKMEMEKVVKVKFK
jgi:hypothetical protein